MKAIFTFSALILSFIGLSQTGPAGIGSSTDNNFWVDANSMNLSNGNSVSVFEDISGNGNDFTQLSSAAQPTFVTSVVNGLPALSFDGDDDVLFSGSIPAIESNEISWYVVYDKAPLDNQGIIGANYASNSKKWLTYCNSANNNVVNGFFNVNSLTFNTYPDNGAFFNFSSNIITTTDLKTYKNSVLSGTKIKAYTPPTGHNFVSLGQYPTLTNSYFHNGRIAEAFVFNRALNDLERVLIDNYLGAKYGKAISNDFYAYEATHNIGLVGLGDDGTNTQTSSQGAGIVEFSNPSAMTSGEYFLVAHTNTDLSVLTSVDIPVSLAGHERWSRTWRVGETGDVGDVDLVFDMSAPTGFGVVGTYNLLVDTDGNFSNATIIPGVYNALTDELSFTVNMADGDYFTISASVAPPVAIRSVATGNWFAPATWDCVCTPTAGDTVYIDNSDVVSVDGAGTAPVYNLIVESSATLNMAQPVELEIGGDFTVDGSLTLTDGTISFKGSAAQVIDGGGSTHDLNNVTIDNSTVSNVKFENGDFILNNTLNPISGIMEIDGTASFVIESSASTTGGRVGVVFPNFSQIGDITVERFIPSGNAHNRNIASPVVGSDLSEWDDSLLISGFGFPDGCAYSGTSGCYYSVKKYQGGLFDSTFIDVTDPNEVLLSTVGYEVFMGDNPTTFSGTTLINNGTLNSSADISLINVPGWWNLFGNPYASPIGFSLLTKTRIGDYFYIFDAASGSYQWYDGSNNTSSTPDLADGKLAIGQAFFCYATAPIMNELRFTQSAKISTDATFVRNSEVENALYLTLKEDNSTYFNVSGLAFNEFADDKVDDFDIHYLSTGKETASSMFMHIENTEKLTKNYLKNENGEMKSIDFTLSSKRSSFYTIIPSSIVDLKDYENVYLIDNELNKVINLGVEGTYTFHSEKGEFERFTVVLTNEMISEKDYFTHSAPATDIENDSSIQIKQLGHLLNFTSNGLISNVTVDVSNILGQKVVSDYYLNDINGTQLLNLERHLSGMYIVVVKEAGVVVATKKIIL